MINLRLKSGLAESPPRALRRGRIAVRNKHAAMTARKVLGTTVLLLPYRMMPTSVAHSHFRETPGQGFPVAYDAIDGQDTKVTSRKCA